MKNYYIRKRSDTKVKKTKKNINHIYTDKNGKRVSKKTIQPYLKMYIAPAYDNVKINLCKDQKVLAIGYDNKQRPQYVYNKEFKQEQSIKKFNHMYDFGLKFKEINRVINSDLYSFSDSKEKQISLILKLIMDCNFRVGNEKYCKENNSFGVTTFQKKHIKIKIIKLQ